MTPLEFLQEECDSVRRTLRETLRHDYGPERSRDYFEECEARLALIEEELRQNPQMAPKDISDNLRDLERIGVRVALIERSHLGEFSWPFTDVIRNFSERLFSEEELYPGSPIVHVVAEGTGYQVVDDPASRTGTRRILIVAFPRQLKHHVLIHAIFGHELGHPAARTDDSGRLAQAALENMEAGKLASQNSVREWFSDANAPAAIKAELKRIGNWTPSTDDLRAWRTELFCDLFGLRLFGPAFAAAQRAMLEPSSGWPDTVNLMSSTHPPYAVRRRLIAQALRLWTWNRAQTSAADGVFYKAEESLLEYILDDGGDDWLTVYPDHILKGIQKQIDDIFQGYGDTAYMPPEPCRLIRLIDRLSLARPPIVEDINEDGEASQHRVSLQEHLYAGWCAWFGRTALREERLQEHPRLRALSFFEMNRLCAQALLQQRAIDTVAEWRRDHPAEEEEKRQSFPPQVGNAESGAIGRSEIIRRLKSEQLSVGPLLSPSQIGASSIDLRMGNVVLIVRARGSSHVDPAKAMAEARKAGHEKETGLQQKHERYELKFKSPFLLHPGALALVPTLEWVSLPPDLMGSVTARSTWAREGLSIATATMIEPGYQGIVTLELANLGEIPIAVYPGLELAQISFFDVVGDTGRPSKGQFELSFEPQQGRIAKETEYPFLPDRPY